VDGPAAAAAILRFTYYWYNFMPLARGTAACGYTTLLALFWAAGMPVTARIPAQCQVSDAFRHARLPACLIDCLLACLLAGWLAGWLACTSCSHLH
jgi:hypothetical protein